MGFYRKLPIQRKLRLIIMACVSAALVLMCVAALIYDQIAFRHTLRNDLAVLAEMIGSSSTAALTFEDDHTAEELLAGLRAKRAIVRAFLYTPEGAPFASYYRDAQAPRPVPPALQQNVVWFDRDTLRLFQFIEMGGQKIGAIYFESDLNELYIRLKRVGGIMVLILMVTTVLALGLSSMLQRAISRPIAKT